jgi:HSP20 family protein
MSRIPFFSPEKLSIEGLQSELSGLVRRWWHCGLNTGPLDGQDWAPPMEVTEEPDCYRVIMELPGVPRDAIELTAQPDGLLISGEKAGPTETFQPAEGEAEPSPRRVLGSERRYGSFRRQVTLPVAIRVNQVLATLKEGVLEVTLPKEVAKGPNDIRIEIRTDASEDIITPS